MKKEYDGEGKGSEEMEGGLRRRRRAAREAAERERREREDASKAEAQKGKT